VALTFGDYLRALITADTDIVPDDDLGYRVAFIEAFQRRGIYPQDVRNLSVESLCWKPPLDTYTQDFTRIARNMDFIPDRSRLFVDRQTTSKEMARYRAMLHNYIRDHLEDRHAFENLTGLALSTDSLPPFLPAGQNTQIKFEVSSLFPVQRIGPDGDLLNQMFFSITQQIPIPIDPKDPGSVTVPFRGGCTLVLDLDSNQLLYRIAKPINSPDRLQNELDYMQNNGSGSLRATYFSHFQTGTEKEPFAQLHRGA
jgi:hypothetical protein